MGNWGWGHGNAKSWGNGILRITIKDAIAVIGAIILIYGTWRDLKDAVNTNKAMTAALLQSVATKEQLQSAIDQGNDVHDEFENRLTSLEKRQHLRPYPSHKTIKVKWDWQH